MGQNSTYSAIWEQSRPNYFDIVTGFFPEVSPGVGGPKCRPLLVTGVAKDTNTGLFWCRVAYATTKNIGHAHPDDLVIGTMSILNELGLKYQSRFCLHPPESQVWLPWTSRHFAPWSGRNTPVLSTLPNELQRDRAAYLSSVVERLPKPPFG